MRIQRLLLPVAFLALFGIGIALGPQESVPIDSNHVAGPVYVFYGAGGNIGVSAGPDGVLLVDSQFARQVPLIREEFGKLTEEPLEYLVNTHWHGDHTGGNPLLGVEATILAHTNVRKRVAADQMLPRGTTQALPSSGLPVITFDDAVSVHFNGEEIRLMHFANAHTDGDSVVWFSDSNVMHTGDLFFAGRFPFIDIDSGGSVGGVIAAVEAMLEWLPADARVIPGHGKLTDVAGLRAYGEFLKDCVGLVEGALEAGQSLEDMQASNLFSKYESYSWNFIPSARFLETVYRDVSAR